MDMMQMRVSTDGTTWWPPQPMAPHTDQSPTFEKEQ